MRVLVTGATGFVGSRLVPALLAADHDVVVLTRDAEGYDGPAEEVREGDILDPGSFEHALEDIEAAYYLIHSMGSGTDFAARDRRAAHNFQRAASEVGIERVVYLGGLGETREQLSKHLQSRREVEAILETGDFALTTLRAAIIVGDGSSSFSMVEQLVHRLPVMVTPTWVRTECQPIAIADVVTYLVGVLDVPETADDTYEIGGPEVLTYQQLLRRTAAVADRPLYIVPVPVLSPQLSTYWVNLVTDVPKSVARPLILGLKNRVVVTDERIEELLPFERTDFETAVERALGRASEPDPERTAARVRAD
ncbi:NAD(P)H-binding protein [Halococcus sp. AFM35]|uniref:NAD(P)H-binding protein n=1 Tax=Halococcus sp. AFM35 TaxID=3421653 RepID=UPI003EBCB696